MSAEIVLTPRINREPGQIRVTLRQPCECRKERVRCPHYGMSFAKTFQNGRCLVWLANGAHVEAFDLVQINIDKSHGG